MKALLLALILTLSIQMSYGQACGVYRVKYVGSAVGQDNIIGVSLPTIQFLHGLENEKSDAAFVEAELRGENIEFVIGSHLTSYLYSDASSYLKLYQSKRDKLLLISVLELKSGKKVEVPIEIPWENIKMIKIEDENFGNIFEIDLGQIEF